MMKNVYLTTLLFLSASISLFAQETEKIKPRLEFTYLKYTDGSRLLTANVYSVKNRISYPVINSKVQFEVGSYKADVLTNSRGIAYLLIDKRTSVEKNAEGFSHFKASFNGNDTLESINDEKLVKDVFLNLILEDVDSIRTIKTRLLTLNEKGDTIPLSGVTVSFYVPRMVNPLKIGEETTDDNGSISLEFPNDLPGSSDSTITVIAKIEEHEQYANVETRKMAHWGIPIIHRIPESHRALWTEIAPVWMIVTLTIMLLGVWGHYIFAIIQLILIKKESKQQKV